MRLLLKLSLSFSLFFAGLMGFIRAQPYDDSDLRAFLMPPEGCPMPCFIGIRAGETRIDEAVRILETHEWVAEVSVSILDEHNTDIYWRWNGRQPVYLRRDPAWQRQWIRVEDRIVEAITIYTNIPLANARMIYGLPSSAIVDVLPSNLYGTIIVLGNGYPALGLGVASYHPCPTALSAFWAAPVSLTFGDYPAVSITPVNGELSSVIYWNQACRG